MLMEKKNGVILRCSSHSFDDLVYLFPKLEKPGMCEISKGAFGESEKV